VLQVNDSEGVFPGLRVAVTGGTSGLGLALVAELLNRGACVAFVARGREGVERVQRDHVAAYGIVGDISKKTAIHPLAPLADTDCEDLERALATNVMGPFRLTKALLGALGSSAREGRGAVVLNISSDAAINAYPSWGAYGASKAALHHLTRVWNEELAAEGIAFLSLDPGDMDTALHAVAVPDADRSTLKRPECAAAELADAIGNLLSFMRSERIVQEAIL
jgi:NAD(P)-dependent dehydrogenase (short-subunit alcohol dehydrogenase family)